MEIEVGQRDEELLLKDMSIVNEMETNLGLSTFIPEVTLEEVRKRIRGPYKKAPFVNSINLLRQISRRDKVLTPY